MKRQTVITYSKPGSPVYGNLRLFCDIHGLNSTWSRKKCPFEHEGYIVDRVPFVQGKAEDNIQARN